MIVLDEQKHIYTNTEDGSFYKSVTTLLSTLQEKFKADEHAARIAERDGLIKEDILAKWKKINEDANEYGTKVHRVMENYIKSPGYSYRPVDEQERQLVSSFQELNVLKSDTVHSEMILYSHEHKIAGTSDIIEEFHDYINVWDFKTNVSKGIQYMSKFNKWLYPPMDHLSDCNFNIYSLQLSLYGVLAERILRKRVGRLGILFLDSTDKKFKLIPVPYLKNDAIRILESYQNKKTEKVQTL